MVASTIPDVPGSVKLQIQRENLLQREMLFEAQGPTTQDQSSEVSEHISIRSRSV